MEGEVFGEFLGKLIKLSLTLEMKFKSNEGLQMLMIDYFYFTKKRFNCVFALRTVSSFTSVSFPYST